MVATVELNLPVLDDCPADVCDSARLLVALANTRASENRRDEYLSDAAGLARWLTAVDLAAGDVRVTDADAAAARELREAFVAVFRSHCGCADAPTDEAQAHLREVGIRYPLVPRITVEGCTFVPSQTGVPGALAAFLAAAADVAARGLWARLKVCKNSTCYSAFFDKTRNLSGQYCSATCGSQVSMRAYRSRLRDA